MENEIAYPFTVEQFKVPDQEHQQAVLAVAEYLINASAEITDEGLSMALNILRPGEGCGPFEEIDMDLRVAVRRKYAAVYQPAVELAEAGSKSKGLEDRKHFKFCLVIEPCGDDCSHVTMVDYEKPICYLHEWSKAWHFCFENLAELAGAVLSAKDNLVKGVIDANKEVFVVLSGGRLREVQGLPPGKEVAVVDYDIEVSDKGELTPSPLDGHRWKLMKF